MESMDHSQHSINGHDHLTRPPIPYADIPETPVTSTSTPPMESFHDHHNHSNGIGGTMDHMMSMAFHFGYNETILFEPWKISTIPGLVGSMVVIFVMAALYEGLKYYREYLFWKTYNLLEYRPVAMPEKGVVPNATEENRASQSIHYVGEVIHKQPPSMMSWMHFYQTFLHIIQVTLSFLLMLIFMTYNVWLCMAVVFGAAFGYFLFCWKKSVIVDVTEHCH